LTVPTGTKVRAAISSATVVGEDQHPATAPVSGRKPLRASLEVCNGDRRCIEERRVIRIATPDNVETLLRTERRLKACRDQRVVMGDEHANSLVVQHGDTPPVDVHWTFDCVRAVWKFRRLLQYCGVELIARFR
jgi:hypothetical protein